MKRPENSICECGHLGDIAMDTPVIKATQLTQHDGIIGHGACLVEGCDCDQFTWVKFNEE